MPSCKHFFYCGPIYFNCMNGPLDEHQLLLKIANDDRKAFNELYTSHLAGVYRYIHLLCKSRETTEELVQDLFVKIWINRKNLERVQFFKSYLFRCAQNLLLDRLRKIQAEGLVKVKAERTQDHYVEESDSHLICNDFKKLTQAAINRLPEKRRQIVELRTHDDLSLDEIAQQLSISKSVVKKQLYSGLSFVREYIHKFDELT